jgi:hypothetical protein
MNNSENHYFAARSVLRPVSIETPSGPQREIPLLSGVSFSVPSTPPSLPIPRSAAKPTPRRIPAAILFERRGAK